jgi:CDP-diacylglycerol--glycerol-3-phosphate 3-phosphatidyltransferase
VPAAGKPLITANQVTVLRLIPMPLLSWLIYKGYERHDNALLWASLIAGILIGCTDWVDGMLARKYGPTVLGGLLDPIADKVFIAFAYTPFADAIINSTGVPRTLVPWWACALMFTREFFITALRSSYAQRDLTLKTSFLGKAKTWTQMQGIGMLLLFPLVNNRNAILGGLIFGIVAPIVLFLGLWLVKRKVWRAAFWMSISFVGLTAVFLYNADYAPDALMIGIVAITWISGLDYIALGWRELRGRGDFTRADGVRLIGGLSLPILLFSLLHYTYAPRWTIFTILAFELAVGGLDNLLSHHKVATKALAWGGRVLGVSILLGAALIVRSLATPLSIVAAAVSVVGVIAEFTRGKPYYVGALD